MTGLRVFLSHASADSDTAVQVHGWLTAAGHEVFLDRHPSDGIAVGDAWEERLHERLRRADAVVCVVTTAYRTSTWCTSEIAVARSRGSRLIPVRAEPQAIHPLLGAVQHADLTADPAGAREHVLATLRRLVAAGGRGWSDERSPFPGLRAFEPEDRLAFFGRDRDIERLAATLRTPGERAALVVVGPSGCGKSSTVRAGLMPTMAAEDGWRVLPPLVPGADPVEALTAALVVAAGRADLGWSPAEVRTGLDRDGLGHLAHDLLLADPASPGRHLLVVVDQLEELVTLTPADERARFAALLVAGLVGPIRVVATLRPEFLGPVLADPALAELNPSIEPLAPLGRDALRLVVEGPAELWGLAVPDELVARLVDDTGAGEALPLLAFTLARLTEHAGRGDTVTVAAYDALGGVAGALTSQADAACADATAATGATRDELLAVLLTLVAVDAQGRPTGRPRHLDGRAAAVAAAFVERRLLVTATAPGGRTTVGVAHETFLSAWPPLREAIAREATALRARGAVEEAARDWDDRKRPADRLWEKGRLSAALADLGARLEPAPPSADDALARPSGFPGRPRTVVSDQVTLDLVSRRFLHASVRRDRFLRSRLVTVLTVLLLAMGLLAAVAANRGSRLDRQLDAANAQLLAAASEARAVDDPSFAAKLALAAWRLDPGGPTVRDALIHRSVELRSVQRIVDGVADRPILAMDTLDPTGRTVVLALEGGGTRLVTDPLGPAPDVWDVPGLSAGARLAQSPDGRWLAATARDGAVNLWDLPARSGPVTLEAASSLTATLGARSVTFSADGSRLLATRDSAGDQKIQPDIAMWDVGTRARVPFPGEPLDGQVTGVWATHDPALILVASQGEGPSTSNRLVSRSLRDGTVAHVFSAGRSGDPPVAVLQGGRTVGTCVAGTPGTGGRDAVAVVDADTAAERARVPVLTSCRARMSPTTGDGGHFLDTDIVQSTVYRPARITEVATGRAVDATLPPGRRAELSEVEPTAVVLTAPDGAPTVLVARGTSVLQLRTSPDPLDRSRGAGSTRLTPDGRAVAASGLDGVVVQDAVTGEVRGRLALDQRTAGEEKRMIVGDDVLVLTADQGQARIATYALPTLTPHESYALPAGANPGRAGLPVVLGDDTRLVAVLDGRIWQWDRRTRQAIGEPIVLGDGPDERLAFQDASVQLRPGRPGQVLVAAIDQPLLLLDLTTGRSLARLPVDAATAEPLFDATGDRVAVLTDRRTVELWDVDAATRVAEPFLAPDTASLLGFTGDGYLVTSPDDINAIGYLVALQLWDVQRGVVSGSLTLADGWSLTRDPVDPVTVYGQDAMPVQLPLTARVWADTLCRAVGPYTDTERRALPAGTEDRAPCP